VDDVGDAVAVEQALDHRQLADVLRISEMNHPHEPPADRSFMRKTCPLVALCRLSLYTRTRVTEFL
jgi:hypothetical protein